MAAGSEADEMARLEARLHQLELDNAQRRLEIDHVGTALGGLEQHAEAAGTLVLHAAASSEVSRLERQVASHEADAASVRVTLSARQGKLVAVQELLDAHEAELYETEEAVRVLEDREVARSRELLGTREQLRRTEARLAMRQREAARAAGMADGVGLSIWNPFVDAPDSKGGRGDYEDGDEDADALARSLRTAKVGQVDPAETGYTQFHTLCMGIKLAAGPANTFVRNLRIDVMWDEVTRQGVPRSEWRNFVHTYLLHAPRPAKPVPGIVETLVASASVASSQLVASVMQSPAKGLVTSVATPAKGLVASVSKGVERLVDDVVGAVRPPAFAEPGGGAVQLFAEPSDEREGREATGEETAEVLDTRLGEVEAAAVEAS